MVVEKKYDRKAELEAQLAQIFKQNPLEAYNNELAAKVLGGHVHHKQLEFHAHKAGPLGWKLLLASNRSGKTVAGVVDDIIQLIPEELVPKHLKAFKKFSGAVTIWVGAPKNENHFNNTIPLFRRFLPKAALKEGKWSKSFRSQPNPRIELANGSEVAFKTYDQDIDAWAGAEVHRIHWDEEPNGSNAQALREEAFYRLASTAGDQIITMTPVLGAYSWVNTEIWDRRDEDPNIFAMKMKIWDNPWNSPEVVNEVVAKAERDGEEAFRTRIEAEFVHLGGLFFPEFREDLHVLDGIAPEDLKGWDVIVAIDPGKRRSGITWTAFDGDNAAVVFDEFFPEETEIHDIADEIKRRNIFWNIEPRYVIDPSSGSGAMTNLKDSVESAYLREEILVERAENTRAAGILEIKRRLQNKTNGKPDPLIHFTRDENGNGCPETIKQAEKYARDPKSKDEWAAVPQNDRVRWDLIDSVRYAVMQRTWWQAEVQPKRHRVSTPTFQVPYAEERIREDVPPLGQFS